MHPLSLEALFYFFIINFYFAALSSWAVLELQLLVRWLVRYVFLYLVSKFSNSDSIDVDSSSQLST